MKDKLWWSFTILFILGCGYIVYLAEGWEGIGDAVLAWLIGTPIYLLMMWYWKITVVVIITLIVLSLFGV